MKVFLFIIAVLAFLSGLGIFGAAASAIHEIEAFMLFLIAAVLLSGAGVIEAVNRLGKEIASSKSS